MSALSVVVLSIVGHLPKLIHSDRTVNKVARSHKLGKWICYSMGERLGPSLEQILFFLHQIWVIFIQTKAMIKKLMLCFPGYFSAPSVLCILYFVSLTSPCLCTLCSLAAMWTIPGIKCRSVAGMPSVQSAYYCSLFISWQFSFLTSVEFSTQWLSKLGQWGCNFFSEG